MGGRYGLVFVLLATGFAGCYVPVETTVDCSDPEMYWDGTACQCPPNLTDIGGSCVDCYDLDVYDGCGYCEPGWEMGLYGCEPTVECGSDEIWDGTYCVPFLECGEDEFWDGTTCIPIYECPAGTYQYGDECLAYECPGNSYWDGYECVCASGTDWDGYECVPRSSPGPTTGAVPKFYGTIAKLLNGPTAKEATSKWMNYDTSASTVFYGLFGDGTGLFTFPGATGAPRSFTWRQTGDAAFVVDQRQTFGSASEVDGGVHKARFAAFLDGNPTSRVFSLDGKPLEPAENSGSPGTIYATDPSGAIRVTDRQTFQVRATISGGNTMLSHPTGIAVDAARGEIYVANGGDDAINVYSTTASGNVVPLRQIKGAATGLDFTPSNQVFSGLVVIPSSGEIAAVNTGKRPATITFHSVAATGNAAPTRTIAGALTNLTGATAIAYDGLHGELFVTDVTASGNPDASGNEAERILTFAVDATGNVAPLRMLRFTLGSNPAGIGVDPSGNELFVGGRVYVRNAEGPAGTPLRTLSNPSCTGNVVAVDPDHDDVVLGGVSCFALMTRQFVNRGYGNHGLIGVALTSS